MISLVAGTPISDSEQAYTNPIRYPNNFRATDLEFGWDSYYAKASFMKPITTGRSS
jgi:hypothetical protein